MTHYLLLPGSSFVERDGLYVNCHGRCQLAGQATAAAGAANDNELTLFALYQHVSFGNICNREYSYLSYMFHEALPHRINYVSKFTTCEILYYFASSCIFLFHIVFFIHIRKYFRTDVISKLNVFLKNAEYAYSNCYRFL